jgi:hypothetical protein
METILTILTPVVAFIVWLVRLESKAKANALKCRDNGEEIKLMKADLAMVKEQHNETKVELAVIKETVIGVKEQNKTIIQLFNDHIFKSKND